MCENLQKNQDLKTPLYLLDDDVLEQIIQFALESASPLWPSHARLITAVRLSQVSAPLRRLILSRGSFWNHLYLNRTAEPALIHTVLTRSKDAPLFVHLDNLFLQKSTWNLHVQAALAGVAARICVLELIDVSWPALPPATPALPNSILEKLSVQQASIAGAVALMGAHTKDMVLGSPYGLTDAVLQAAFSAAPNLVTLQLIGISSAAASGPPLAVPQNGVRSNLRKLLLKEIPSAVLERMVALIEEHYPNTFLNARHIHILPSIAELSVQRSLIPLQLKRLHPNALSVGRDGEYTVRATHGRTRIFYYPRTLANNTAESIASREMELVELLATVDHIKLESPRWWETKQLLALLRRPLLSLGAPRVRSLEFNFPLDGGSWQRVQESRTTHLPTPQAGIPSIERLQLRASRPAHGYTTKGIYWTTAWAGKACDVLQLLKLSGEELENVVVECVSDDDDLATTASLREAIDHVHRERHGLPFFKVLIAE